MAQSAMILSMSFYAQTDNRYKNILIGYNTEQPWNIGNYGCVCTSWANMLVAITGDQGYTPAMVNAWMQQHQGFDPGGGIFRWWVALGMGHVEFVKDTTDISEVNAWVKDPSNYAIICYNKGGHYCLSNISGQIVDSEDGKVKGIGAYAFTSAKLYRSIEPGRGNITTSATSVGDEPVIGDTDNEFNRWNKLFRQIRGRQASRAEFQAAAIGQSWLHAMEILSDSTEADQATADGDLGAQARMQNWQQQISDLTSKLTLATTTIWPKVMSDEPDFTLTSQDDDRPRVAGVDGVSIDFSGEQPDRPFAAGTVFHQAQVYVIDNVVMIRTHTSVDGNTWYLTDQMYFDDVPTVIATSTAHANASMAVGVISRIVNSIMSLFKKGPIK